MIDVVTQSSPQAPSRPAGADASRPGAARAKNAVARDSVELSRAAQSEVDGADQPLRDELVRRVRAEIEAGTYQSEEKLEVVVERLHRELRGGV